MTGANLIPPASCHSQYALPFTRFVFVSSSLPSISPSTFLFTAWLKAFHPLIRLDNTLHFPSSKFITPFIRYATLFHFLHSLRYIASWHGVLVLVIGSVRSGWSTGFPFLNHFLGSVGMMECPLDACVMYLPDVFILSISNVLPNPYLDVQYKVRILNLVNLKHPTRPVGT